MIISIIVAMGKNRVIGKDNELLWKMSADLKYFRSKTLGKPIIMGRKTFASIGKVLPGRENIILTRDKEFFIDGAIIFHTLEESLAYLEQKSCLECMIIGGGMVYKQALPRANKLYITEVDCDLPGDTYFPKLDVSQWQEVMREEHSLDDKNQYNYSYLLFDRKD